ncbi:hypothetical protein [Vibrio sp. WXL210]|uniref:hypothetical protein n=1 Tax=Vibrio sp. WXL210 TaxID=3450709 RepID=UPI003EC575F2
MSIKQYNHLAQDSHQTLAVKIPQMTSAQLSLQTMQGEWEQVLQAITRLQPTDGWVMYRDKVELSADLPTRQDVLEAEYANGTRSLAIRLLSAKRYQMTEFDSSDNEGETHAYYEQSLILRKHLQGQAQTALYRIWFEQTDSRWLPKAQQFIGLSKEAHYG